MQKYDLSKVLCIASFFTSLGAMHGDGSLRPFGGEYETPFEETPHGEMAEATPDVPLAEQTPIQPARSLTAAQPLHAYGSHAIPADDSRGLGGWMRKNPHTSGAVALTAAQAAAVVIAYKKNEKFKMLVDQHSGAAKRYVLRNVALPAAMKIEEIKTEGLSRYDMLKGALFCLGCYGVKKVGDYFHLWSAIRTRDFTKPRAVTKSLLATLYDNKKKILAGTVCVIAAYWLWKFSQGVNKLAKIPLLDQFFLSLTSEQRIEIMQSSEMSKLVSDAAEDPLPLPYHERFMALLTDEQKKKLNAAVEDYIKNNVPLAFLESDLL